MNVKLVRLTFQQLPKVDYAAAKQQLKYCIQKTDFLLIVRSSVGQLCQIFLNDILKNLYLHLHIIICPKLVFLKIHFVRCPTHLFKVPFERIHIVSLYYQCIYMTPISNNKNVKSHSEKNYSIDDVVIFETVQEGCCILLLFCTKHNKNNDRNSFF